MPNLYKDVWGVILHHLFEDISHRSSQISMIRRLVYWKTVRRVNREWKHFADHFFVFDNHFYHLALSNNNVEAVRFLIDKNGIDMESSPEYLGWTHPLAYAAQLRSTEIVKMLLERGADPNVGDGEPLGMALSSGSIDTIKLLLEHPKIDVDSSCLFSAINSKKEEVVEMVLKIDKVNPQLVPQALENAAHYCERNTRILTLLLEDGRIDPTTTDVLNIVIESKLLKSLKLLLNDERFKPLIRNSFEEVILSKDQNIIMAFIDSPHMNLDDKSANTLFKQMCRENLFKVVEKMLKNPLVDPTLDESECLKMAVTTESLKVVQTLLKDNRVDPKSSDFFALKESLRSGNTEIANLLLPFATIPTLVDIASNMVQDPKLCHWLFNHPIVNPIYIEFISNQGSS